MREELKKTLEKMELEAKKAQDRVEKFKIACEAYEEAELTLDIKDLEKAKDLYEQLDGKQQVDLYNVSEKVNNLFVAHDKEKQEEIKELLNQKVLNEENMNKAYELINTLLYDVDKEYFLSCAYDIKVNLFDCDKKINEIKNLINKAEKENDKDKIKEARKLIENLDYYDFYILQLENMAAKAYNNIKESIETPIVLEVEPVVEEEKKEIPEVSVEKVEVESDIKNDDENINFELINKNVQNEVVDSILNEETTEKNNAKSDVVDFDLIEEAPLEINDNEDKKDNIISKINKNLKNIHNELSKNDNSEVVDEINIDSFVSLLNELTDDIIDKENLEEEKVEKLVSMYEGLKEADRTSYKNEVTSVINYNNAKVQYQKQDDLLKSKRPVSLGIGIFADFVTSISRKVLNKFIAKFGTNNKKLLIKNDTIFSTKLHLNKNKIEKLTYKLHKKDSLNEVETLGLHDAINNYTHNSYSLIKETMEDDNILLDADRTKNMYMQLAEHVAKSSKTEDELLNTNLLIQNFENDVDSRGELTESEKLAYNNLIKRESVFRKINNEAHIVECLDTDKIDEEAKYYDSEEYKTYGLPMVLKRK